MTILECLGRVLSAGDLVSASYISGRYRPILSQCPFDRSVSTFLFAAYWVTTVRNTFTLRSPCTLACWDLTQGSSLPAFFPALSFDNQSLDKGNALTSTL